MDYHRNPSLLFSVLLLWLCIASCSDGGNAGNTVVRNPEKMDEQAGRNIEELVEAAVKNSGKVDDSTQLHMTAMVHAFYQNNDFQEVWSRKEKWTALADSLFSAIRNAELQGLFPADYHGTKLQSLRRLLDADSLKRLDEVLWLKADLLLTDGFVRMARDLKLGRLRADSVMGEKDTVLADNFYVQQLKQLLEKKQFTSLLNALQPGHRGYWELKQGIKPFLDSMDKRVYTYVPYPYKDSADSIRFVKTLQKRLGESGCIDAGGKRPDSALLLLAVKKYQKQKGIAADGKITASLMRTINTSDAERFKRIAITLDRYKKLPARMPERYIWVNLPSFMLQVWDHDTLVMESRTVVGKPHTRTPLLTSTITDMVTYPTWTVPTSIIAKEMLPGLKRNPGYLARRGYKLLNGKGQAIDAASINWSKYTKGIPYRIQQGSGDGNALGVFKFNFNNAHAVYLHDTNQRYLFKNGSRALSHGCVRVQDWQKLAFYVARIDSMNARPQDSLRYNTDSIKNWISAKSHRRMDVKTSVGVYFYYFGCEGKNGKVKFYEDIYGEDKVLREKYFAGK